MKQNFPEYCQKFLDSYYKAVAGDNLSSQKIRKIKIIFRFN